MPSSIMHASPRHALHPNMRTQGLHHRHCSCRCCSCRSCRWMTDAASKGDDESSQPRDSSHHLVSDSHDRRGVAVSVSQSLWFQRKTSHIVFVFSTIIN
jgi:hypothetical protein